MPVITISRQFGAGGKTLGSMVAERLGYRFLSEKDTLEAVAERANVSVEMVKGVEKEAGSRLMRVLCTLVPTAFIERHVGDAKTDLQEEKKYVEVLSEVIREAADQGNVVIIGWGGQFILSGRPDCYKILLVGERPDRIQFMIDRYGLTPSKAEHVVTREEKRRIRFLENFQVTDPDEPSLYHNVINTSLVNLETACEVICGLVE